MQFLFPGFLFALVAVAIPVIIHLFNFRRFKKVYFSNVTFLKEIEQQTSSARNIKHLLLLLARILVIIFLVLAFAQPFILQSDKIGSAFKQQAVSVFIDNSYSMETLNEEGSLLDEAKRRAKEVASAYSVSDKFQLLTNDFEGKHQRLLSYDDFIQAVDEVKISALSKNLEQITKRQQEVFSGEPNSNKTAYIISDFQKNILHHSPFKPDSGLSVHFVMLEANALANISVDSVWFTSPVHRSNQPEKLVVQLKNNSDKPAQNIPLKVLIDGKPKALGSLSIAARAAQKDTLSFSGLTAGWKRGLVQITDYPVVFDDEFHFTFNVRQQMPVLAISGTGENQYINALYSAESFFHYRSSQTGSLDYSRLMDYPFIILSETSSVSAGLAEQLHTYVENGGSLMVFPSVEEDLTALKTLNQTLGVDIPYAIINKEEKASVLNYQHPVFGGVFVNKPDRMDLPIAKTYVQYGKASNRLKQNILAFAANRTFLSQYAIGKGNVYLSAVALNEESSNFVRHSVFVPIMYQLAFLSLKDNKLFYTLGKDQYLESNKITLSANQTLKLKKENYEAIPDIRQTPAGTRLFISDQIQQAGNYELLKGDSLLSVFAFNDDRLESDLSYLKKADLDKVFPTASVEILNPGKASLQNEIKAVNNGVQLWKVCLILALLFLAAEILLVRFYKTRESKLNL